MHLYSLSPFSSQRRWGCFHTANAFSVAKRSPWFLLSDKWREMSGCLWYLVCAGGLRPPWALPQVTFITDIFNVIFSQSRQTSGCHTEKCTWDFGDVILDQTFFYCYFGLFVCVWFESFFLMLVKCLFNRFEFFLMNNKTNITITRIDTLCPHEQ